MMNHLHRPCERWAEPISMAAAGCLSPEAEQEVRRHLETCPACRERLRQLQQLCGALAEAASPGDAPTAAIVGRVMSALAAEKSPRPATSRRAEMIHPTLRIRSLSVWRWIMRSPVPRVAAAAIVVVVVGLVFWLPGGGATPAFANFIAPILQAKTAKLKLVTEMTGPSPMTIPSELMVLSATRWRQEIVQPNKSKAIMIYDLGQRKSLTLDPANKKALVLTLANMTDEQLRQQDMFGWFRSILADARDKPDIEREPLGESEIDGQRVVGFRVRSKGMVTSLWGDPKTGLPVRAEMTMAVYSNAKTTLSDFEFNVDLDPSLFSVEPPAGYTVQSQQIDVSLPEEKDLIAAFREYLQLSGGPFPGSLDLQATMQAVGRMIGKKITIPKICAEQAARMGLTEEQKRQYEEFMIKLTDSMLAPENEKPSKEELEKIEQQMHKSIDRKKLGLALEQGKSNKQELIRKASELGMQELIKVQVPIQRGLLFVFSLPADADAHYAGKGVSSGAADKPIFWYRPKDATKYRVIFADLSIREADVPPSVPDAQPVAAPSVSQE